MSFNRSRGSLIGNRLLERALADTGLDAATAHYVHLDPQQLF
jgi:hypothetical protein